MALRVNQKERTRRALVEAAQAILRDGRELTITGAAQAAQVSAATAYRYFSQPQELVLEAVFLRTPEVSTDLPDEPAVRLDETVRRLTQLQLGDEQLWRAVLAATLAGSTAVPAEGALSHVRRGGRMEITLEALRPLEPMLGPALHRRLTMAVMLIYGMEALVVTREACGLEPDEALAVMRWAAQALLEAALREAGAVGEASG
jgi:hypothetical protein